MAMKSTTPKQQRHTRRQVLKYGMSGAVLTAGTLAAPALVRAQAKSIRFWTWLDSNDSNPRAQVQKALVERFMDETGIEVNTEVVDWRTLAQQLLRAVAAGEGPDVTRVYSAWLPEQVAANTLLPLGDVIDAVWSAEKKADVGPPLPTYNGNPMAMYIENRMYLMYYRKDFLDEAGLEVPKSFADMSAAVQKLSSPRRSAMIWPASLKSSDTYAYASPMVWSAGGALVHQDKSAAFNEGGAVDFYKWLKALITEHNAMPNTMISVDEEVLQQAMNSGTCAMAFMGTNRVASTRASLATDDPSVLQTTHAPSKDGSPPPVPVAGWCLGVTQNSKDPETAFRFIDAMTNTEAQIMNAKDAGEMPVRKSAISDPWFSTPEAAEMKSWIEYIAAHGHDAPSQKLVKSREFNRMLNLATQEMVLEDADVQTSLNAAAEEWNKIKE